MSDKLFLMLFICLLGLQINCQTGQVPVSVQKQSAEGQSDEKIKQLFVDSGLGEDDGFYKELMTFPKERIIAVVQKIRQNGLERNNKQYQTEDQNEHLKLKSAYFLWKLGVDRQANEKYVVDAVKLKDNRRFFAMSYLTAFIDAGKREYVPMILKAAPEANGADANLVQGFVVIQLEEFPKVFLLELSKENSKVRKSVYELVAYTEEVYSKEEFEKVKASLEKLKGDNETKLIATEFLQELGKKQ